MLQWMVKPRLASTLEQGMATDGAWS